MIILTETERQKLKDILSIVYEDTATLRAEFRRASTKARCHPGDHQSGVLRMYANVLESIIEDRARPLPSHVKKATWPRKP